MIEIDTKRRMEIIDITYEVESKLKDNASHEGGFSSGLCLVYSMHTTTGLIVNEADGALIEDILDILEKIVPREQAISMIEVTAMLMHICGPH